MGYRLSIRQYGILAIGVAVLFGWVLVDQVFLASQVARIIAFTVLTLVLMVAYFRIIDPTSVWGLSRHLGVVLLVVTVVLGAIMHLVVTWEPRVLFVRSWRIWLIVLALPFFAGWIHRLYRHAASRA